MPQQEKLTLCYVRNVIKETGNCLTFCTTIQNKQNSFDKKKNRSHFLVLTSEF